MQLSNHYAVQLKLIQNIKCKLQLKNKRKLKKKKIYHVNICLGGDWRKDRDLLGVGHWEMEIVPNFESTVI